MANGQILVGCYRISLRPRAGAAAIQGIEERVWLTTVELTPPPGVTRAYVVRPAPGERASNFDAVYWSPRDSAGVTVVWTTGFNGVSLTLQISSVETQMTGEAKTFTDILGAEPSIADAIATKTDC